MTHLYYVTPDFAITLDAAEATLVSYGYRPYIPRPIREHLGLMKATPEMVQALALEQEQKSYSHRLEEIETQLEAEARALNVADMARQAREDAEFDAFWDADRPRRLHNGVDFERPSPISEIIDEAMDRIDVMSLEFEPWVVPEVESLHVTKTLPITQHDLPF